MNSELSKEARTFLADLLQGKQTILKSGAENAKLAKNSRESYILNLLPANGNSFGYNVCPFATKGCIQSCLNLAGYAKYAPAQKRRKLLTDIYFKERLAFYRKLRQELEGLNLHAQLKETIINIRLNGTSDLDWYKNFKAFLGFDLYSLKHLQFYDYTKSIRIWKQHFNSSFHITFSAAETNWNQCEEVLNAGGTVAVVFHPKLPETYKGYPVFDGDQSDERYLDPKGHIIGLKYKKVKGNKVAENDFVIKL